MGSEDLFAQRVAQQVKAGPTLTHIKNDWSLPEFKFYFRVKAILKDSPCLEHRVCQIFPPESLEAIDSDATCHHEVEHNWWLNFHKIQNIIYDFEQSFSEKFDIATYSIMFNVDKCQVRG